MEGSSYSPNLGYGSVTYLGSAMWEGIEGGGMTLYLPSTKGFLKKLVTVLTILLDIINMIKTRI